VRAFRQALTPQQPPARGAGEPDPVLLSSREREILAFVARGLGDREIAEQLVLSPHTVHRHVANIRRKLGRTSRTAAVAEAARLGLL
jgi:DNA-binding NarL/FixJ family response regulator